MFDTVPLEPGIVPQTRNSARGTSKAPQALGTMPQVINNAIGTRLSVRGIKHSATGTRHSGQVLGTVPQLVGRVLLTTLDTLLGTSQHQHSLVAVALEYVKRRSVTRTIYTIYCRDKTLIIT